MGLGGRVFAEYSIRGNPEWGLPSAIREDGFPLRIWQVGEEACALSGQMKISMVQRTSFLLSVGMTPILGQVASPRGSHLSRQVVCEQNFSQVLSSRAAGSVSGGHTPASTRGPLGVPCPGVQ